jgi:hypothetical protein
MIVRGDGESTLAGTREPARAGRPRKFVTPAVMYYAIELIVVPISELTSTEDAAGVF